MFKDKKTMNSENEPKDGAVPAERVEITSEDREGSNGEALASCIDRLQRLQAEFENYKKRTARETLSLEERISDRTIVDFLGLFDTLQRAFTSYTNDGNVESFVDGMQQIFGQFSQLLERLDVERLGAVGERFDPALHEALLCVESDEEKNTILEEFLPGYVRQGRVLRAAKVSVSQGPAPVEEEDA